MSVILAKMDEAIMLKKRKLETGAAVKPEASMPNGQAEDSRASQLQKGKEHPLTILLSC